MQPELKKTIKKECPDSRILKVGRWDWIYFTSKPAEKIRQALKEARFHYNFKRECWQCANGIPSRHSASGARALFAKYGARELEDK